jgi:hypothetical protein
MPFDSQGIASISGQRPVNGQDTDAAQINVPLNDIQSMLSQVLLRSGVAPMTGNLNMNGFKLTGVGTATTDGDAVNLAQFNAVKNRLSVKSTAYQINSDDYGATIQFTAAVSATVGDVSTFADGWFSEVWSVGGTVTITPTSPQTINGLASLTLSRGQSAVIFKTGASTLVANVTGGIWASKGIGEIYMVDTSLVGVDIPPISASDVTYIQLTSGLTGVGLFNAGKLTGETTTGTAPLVSSSAVISVTGSPLNGKTVRLINTESRILRPSLTAGSLQDDAIQNITGTLRLNKTSTSIANGPFDAADFAGNAETGGVATGTNITFDASRSVRTANETRMKNVGVTAFMRVK